MSRGALLVLLACTLGAPLVGLGAEQAPARPGWTWDIRATPDLARLQVSVCFREFRPRRLVLPLAAGRDALRLVRGTDDAPFLVPDGDGWQVADPLERPSPCVGYEVDVAALVAAGLAERVGADLLTQPGAWLLVPGRFTAAEEARATFTLPQDLATSAPWPRRADGQHEVPASAFAFESRVAFGRFVPRRLAIAGAAFDLVVLDAPRAASDAGIERWIRAAGEAVAGLYGGRFPVGQVQVLVEPVRASREPVVFGRALQAGGAAVLLYLGANARDEDLPLEWIAVHELTHLGMPWIVGEDAWLSEGFVTYYQETLRGRVGYYGDAGAWRALEEGFTRGRRNASDRSIAEDSRTMHQRHLYHRVYWAGAALAMRIDLALRAETGGLRSLDDVMRLWASPSFVGRAGWRALDLLAEADRLLGTRACLASVRAPLASNEFPATDDLLATLGLAPGPEGRLVAGGGAREAALRRSIGGGQ